MADTVLQDAGAPFVHHDDPAPSPPKPEKSESDKQIEVLQNDNKALRTRLDEETRNSQAWSERALRANRQPEPEAESDDPPPIEDDPARPEVKPEQFLDDIAKEGMAALKKHGFMTDADVRKLVKETEERTAARVAAQFTDQSFDAKLGAEFPELVADAKAVANGQQPKSEIYKRAGEIYRDAIAEDPQLRGSKSALLIAARQAKAELAGKKAVPNGNGRLPAHDEPERVSRRERIERLGTGADPAPGSEGDDAPSLTDEQRQFAKGMGISEAAYMKQLQKGAKKSAK